MEPPLPEVRPEDDELSDVEESVELSDVEESVALDDVSESPLVALLELLDPVLSLAVVSAVSACIVPMSANTPAAAASVTAAVAAATRRVPLRTAAVARLSLTVMTVPLRSDAVSRPTVGERPERSL
ncbi:hypothetical protein AB0L99_37845 [Streptomyces sp. NPDC051954]|uniref:hypothetical protein n=1 Tax=unclassified Streptomyces TaxID=2593676 RepID=UPI00341919F6